MLAARMGLVAALGSLALSACAPTFEASCQQSYGTQAACITIQGSTITSTPTTTVPVNVTVPSGTGSLPTAALAVAPTPGMAVNGR